MFEIGSSLHQARERQRLELSDVERVTHIRARYLGALEDERFELLPGRAYAQGFLRTYADFLGLEGRRFVDEYNERFAPDEERPVVPFADVRRRPLRLRLWLVIGAFAVLLSLIGWRLSTLTGHGSTSRARSTPTVTHQPQPSRVAVAPQPRVVAHTTGARIAFSARGPCWISVRLRSARGPLLYERTLQPGASVRFAGKRLWIRIGAPWNLSATLNGKPARLPGAVANVLVTRAGIHTA